MKFTAILLPLFSLSIAFSQSSQWTSSDGRNAVMNLLSVSEDGGKLSGKFKMSNGTVVTLSEDKLAKNEKTRLQEKFEEQKTKPEEVMAASKEDLIAPALEKNLLVFDGKRIKRLSDFTPPSKYYLFYETASWCPPCQKFTPDLVKFYDKYKKTHGDQFEIILLTSDKSEDAQEEYAKNKKMEWPQLDYKDTQRFEEKFGISSSGIPALTLTDVTGKIISKGNAFGMLSKVEKELK